LHGTRIIELSRSQPVSVRLVACEPPQTAIKEDFMHRLICALALVVATAACTVKSERTVQSPPPATVTTTAPASSTTYVSPSGNTTTVTTPAPAASTTVYTR
jgi:hypothetical protein